MGRCVPATSRVLLSIAICVIVACQFTTHSITLPTFLKGTVPRIAAMPLESDGIELGCRVMKAEDVHSAVRMLPIGTTPQFTQITLSPPLKDVAFGDHGWRIESFIADEVLRCREGRRFDETQDADLHALSSIFASIQSRP
jgi:hypothetical protein